MPILSLPHHSDQICCTNSANLLLIHLSVELDSAVPGSDLLLSYLHRKNLAACICEIPNGSCKLLPKSTYHFLYEIGNWEVAIVAVPKALTRIKISLHKVPYRTV